MTDNTYWLRAKVGPYSWEIASGDLASELVAAVQHLDGWSIGWSMPDDSQGQLYPQQLPPLLCTIYVRTLDTANLDQLREGQDMAVEAWTADPDLDPAAVKFASFYGRLTDCDAVPIITGDDVTWMAYSIMGASYEADLAQLPVPALNWPSEVINSRIRRIAYEHPAVKAAGNDLTVVWRVDTFPGDLGSNPFLAAQAYGGGNMLDALIAACDEVVTRDMGTDSALARPMLVPVCTWEDGLVAWEFQYWAVEMTGDADYLPGVPELVDDGAGGLQLIIDWGTTALDPDPDGWAPALAVDGSTVVRTSATWKLTSGRINALQENGTFGGVPDSITYANGDQPQSLLTRTSQLTNVLDALSHAAMYVPPAGQAPENWAMSDFTYRVPQTQLEDGVRTIPDHAGGFAPLLQLATWPSSQPVVVYGIEDGKSPTGKTTLVGRLQACTLTIVKGRVELQAKVRRGFNPPWTSTITGITMDELNTAFPDVTDQPRHNANLLANSGFEVDLAGWAGGALSNCTIARSTAQKKHGVASVAQTITGVAGGLAYFGATAAADMPVVAGETYMASLYWRPAAARDAGSYVQWYNAGGGFISQNIFATVGVPAGGWTRVSGAVVAPAGAVKARFVPVIAALAGDVGLVHYVDSIQLEHTTELLPYEAPEYPTRYLDPDLTWDDFTLVRSV